MLSSNGSFLADPAIVAPVPVGRIPTNPLVYKLSKSRVIPDHPRSSFVFNPA